MEQKIIIEKFKEIDNFFENREENLNDFFQKKQYKREFGKDLGDDWKQMLNHFTNDELTDVEIERAKEVIEMYEEMKKKKQ